MKVKNRIKSSKEFEDIIHHGVCLKNKYLVLYYRSNDFGFSRIGISIPTKCGNAVVRNKIKRQLRAILAANHSFDIAKDYIFVARLAFDIRNFQTTTLAISDLLQKAGNN